MFLTKLPIRYSILNSEYFVIREFPRVPNIINEFYRPTNHSADIYNSCIKTFTTSTRLNKAGWEEEYEVSSRHPRAHWEREFAVPKPTPSSKWRRE